MIGRVRENLTMSIRIDASDVDIYAIGKGPIYPPPPCEYAAIPPHNEQTYVIHLYL